MQDVRPFSFGTIDTLRSAYAPADLRTWSLQEKIQWIGRVLSHVSYGTLSRTDKGLIRRYLQESTGYSRAQTARYISAHQKTQMILPRTALRSLPHVGRLSLVVSAMALMLFMRASEHRSADVLRVLNAERTTITGDDLHASALTSSTMRMFVVNTIGTGTGAQPLLAISEQTVTTSGRASARETLLSWSLQDLLRRVGERKEARMRMLPDGRTAIRPDVLTDKEQFPAYALPPGAHTAAPAVWDMPVNGTEGQILMVQNGRIVWRDFPYLQQIRSLPAHGSEPTTRAGGRRSGGGGGGSSTSTTTTIIQQVSGSSTPSGWTDGDSIVYLTATGDRVGIGTDATENKLEVVGSISGASLYISASMSGAGLTDCDLANKAVQWDSTTGRFSCTTIVGGSSTFGSGNVVFIGDTRYLRTSGGTMTGALTINITNGTYTTLGLEIQNLLSGAVIRAQESLASSGSLNIDGTAYFNSASPLKVTNNGFFGCTALETDADGDLVCGSDGGGVSFGSGNVVFIGDTRYLRTSGGTMTGALNVQAALSGSSLVTFSRYKTCTLKTTATGMTICGADIDTNTTYTAGQGLTLVSTSFKTNATLTGTSILFTTISGSYIHAEKTLTSSGTLTWEGAASGSSLYVATSIQGSGLIDCDLTNSTLRWDSTTGRFSCGTSSTFGSGNVVTMTESRFVNVGGDTMTGALTVNITNGNNATIGLKIINALSGSYIHAEKSLSTSGTLVWEGIGSGSSLTLAGGNLTVSSTGSTVFNENSYNVDIRMEGDTNANLFYLDASSDRIGIAKLDPRTTLDVAGTVSGSTLIASILLSTSGSLIVKNDALIQQGAIRPRYGVAFHSGTLVNEFSGFTNFLNVQNGGMGLGGVRVISPTANLQNIGAIQAGETKLTSAGLFLPRTNYGMGSNPDDIVVMDFNGDGRMDTAIVNEGEANMVVRLNLGGTGSLGAKAQYGGGSFENGIAAGDVTGDGKPDIIGTARSSTTMQMFRNKGDGTFAAGVTYATASTPRGVALGDVNGDGRLDVIVANNGAASVSVFRNVGNGVFAPKQDFTTGSGPYDVAVGDMNGDGKPDIVTANRTAGSLSFLRNTGTGSFANKEDKTTGSLAQGIAMADVSGDGKADVAVANNGATTVSVFINSGTGGLISQYNYTTGTNPASVVLGDVTGDGKADMVTANFGANTVSVFRNTGTGAFAAKVDYTTGVAPVAVALGDLSGDGKNEIVTADQSEGMSVLTNITKTLFYASAGSGMVGIGTDNPTSRLTVSGAILVDADVATAGTNLFTIVSNVGGSNNTVFRISGSGAVYADGVYNSAGADYAEWFRSGSNHPALVSGEVVCIDVTKANTVKRCEHDADSNIMGIVSTNPAFVGNVITGADGIMPPGYALIGLIGQVPANVMVENGEAIRPGDSLTAASVPGYARRARSGESTVGVALEPLASGEGVVNVLISRRNQSLTVEAVEEKVLKTIAAMEIEDEVQLMVAGALGDLNVDAQISDEVQKQIAAMQGTGTTMADLQMEIDQLKAQIASGSGADAGNMGNVETPWHGVSTGGHLAAQSLELDDTLITGGSARIGGDLSIDGTLNASSLFVPNGLIIDGGVVMNGILEAQRLRIADEATVDGILTIKGRLALASGAILDLGSGALSISDLVVEHALFVMGDITIQGLATFLGDITVKGELMVSSNQAGFALIPKTGTSVTIHFGTGFRATPVVTASPDVPVLYAVSKTTSSGFTIRIAAPAEEDITFSWHALSTGAPVTIRAEVTAEGMLVFPTDNLGVPVSGNMAWNACIRNITMLDVSGQPLSCARYHDQYTWTHPDLGITFLWNTSVEPALLKIPDGYSVQVTEASVSIEEAIQGTMTGEEGTDIIEEGEEMEDGEELVEIPAQAPAPVPVEETQTELVKSLPSPETSPEPAVGEPESASVEETPVETEPAPSDSGMEVLQ